MTTPHHDLLIELDGLVSQSRTLDDDQSMPVKVGALRSAVKYLNFDEPQPNPQPQAAIGEFDELIFQLAAAVREDNASDELVAQLDAANHVIWARLGQTLGAELNPFNTEVAELKIEAETDPYVLALWTRGRSVSTDRDGYIEVTSGAARPIQQRWIAGTGDVITVTAQGAVTVMDNSSAE